MLHPEILSFLKQIVKPDILPTPPSDNNIPTNIILTNYLRGSGIIPDPQTRPSSFLCMSTILDIATVKPSNLYWIFTLQTSGIIMILPIISLFKWESILSTFFKFFLCDFMWYFCRTLQHKVLSLSSSHLQTFQKMEYYIVYKPPNISENGILYRVQTSLYHAIGSIGS